MDQSIITWLSHIDFLEKNELFITKSLYLYTKESRYREKKVDPEAYQMYQNIRSDNIFFNIKSLYIMWNLGEELHLYVHSNVKLRRHLHWGVLFSASLVLRCDALSTYFNIFREKTNWILRSKIFIFNDSSLQVDPRVSSGIR